MSLGGVEFSTGHPYGRGFGPDARGLKVMKLSGEFIEAQALPLTVDMRSGDFDAEGVDMPNIRYITLKSMAESFP